MRKLDFDEKIFNWGYAYIYSLLQCIFAVGFIVVLGLITIDVKITISDVFLPIAVSYLFISFIGFPLVTVIKIGYKRLVIGSTVTYDGETIIYDKLADRLWTAVGHVEEHHIYTASQIESVMVTKFAYIVKGNIEKVVVNNGRKLETKKIGVVKIPNAYAHMHNIHGE